MKRKQASSNRRTHRCVGIYSCATTGAKMPVAPSSFPHACVSTQIQINVYTGWGARWRYSADCCRQTQACPCVLFYTYASAG